MSLIGHGMNEWLRLELVQVYEYELSVLNSLNQMEQHIESAKTDTHTFNVSIPGYFHDAQAVYVDELEMFFEREARDHERSIKGCGFIENCDEPAELAGGLQIAECEARIQALEEIKAIISSQRREPWWRKIFSIITSR